MCRDWWRRRSSPRERAGLVAAVVGGLECALGVGLLLMVGSDAVRGDGTSGDGDRCGGDTDRQTETALLGAAAIELLVVLYEIWSRTGRRMFVNGVDNLGGQRNTPAGVGGRLLGGAGYGSGRGDEADAEDDDEEDEDARGSCMPRLRRTAALCLIAAVCWTCAAFFGCRWAAPAHVCVEVFAALVFAARLTRLPPAQLLCRPTTSPPPPPPPPSGLAAYATIEAVRPARSLLSPVAAPSGTVNTPKTGATATTVTTTAAAAAAVAAAVAAEPRTTGPEAASPMPTHVTPIHTPHAYALPVQIVAADDLASYQTAPLGAAAGGASGFSGPIPIGTVPVRYPGGRRRNSLIFAAQTVSSILASSLSPPPPPLSPPLSPTRVSETTAV